MALIKCPECGTEVSSFAERCPKCSYPVSGGGSTQASGGKIQTIELTSKSLKLQQLLCALLCIISIFLMISDCSGETPSSGLGVFLFFISIVWAIILKFKTWWHHK